MLVAQVQRTQMAAATRSFDRQQHIDNVIQNVTVMFVLAEELRVTRSSLSAKLCRQIVGRRMAAELAASIAVWTAHALQAGVCKVRGVTMSSS